MECGATPSSVAERHLTCAELQQKREIKKIELDPVTEVTDADLLSAVTAKMKKTNNPIAIKDVVRKTLTAAGIVNHTGKQVRDIPMSHRPIFLEHLGAL